MALGIPIVALTAALTLACQARLLGTGLLGEPREAPPVHAFDPPGAAVTGALTALAAMSVALAWFPGPVVAALARAVGVVAPSGDTSVVVAAVRPIGNLSLALAAVAALVAGLRAALVRRGPVRAAVTWDCGYAHPGARMQYSASSLAQPIAGAFAALLRTRVERSGPGGHWPAKASWRSRTLDRTVTGVYRPAFGGLNALLLRLRDLQEPRVTTYLRYVVLALVVVLALLFLPIVPRP
jgi:hypothetical protein